MSVILTLGDTVMTQGYTTEFHPTITNSGTENVENVYLKVIGSAVFTELKVFTKENQWRNCLDTFSSYYIVIDGGFESRQLPAGATYTIRLDPLVKASAPVQVHNLSCAFQYIVY